MTTKDRLPRSYESDLYTELINDMMVAAQSQSSSEQDTSARGKFDAFLRRHHKKKSLLSFTCDNVTKEMVGQFLTFLFKYKFI